MLLTLWRFLVLWTFLFWQGGFLFYSTVVVHIGRDVIGHTQQGLITRHVTVWMNLAGGVALLVLAVDFFVAWERRPWHRWALVACWAGMAASLLGLIVLHPRLDAMIESESYGAPFRRLHSVYLSIITVQWACALAYSLLTLAAWRSCDAARGPGRTR
jgi:hypothetical protein